MLDKSAFVLEHTDLLLCLSETSLNVRECTVNMMPGCDFSFISGARTNIML